MISRTIAFQKHRGSSTPSSLSHIISIFSGSASRLCSECKIYSSSSIIPPVISSTSLLLNKKEHPLFTRFALKKQHSTTASLSSTKPNLIDQTLQSKGNTYSFLSKLQNTNPPPVHLLYLLQSQESLNL